ncbi:hypothetical protein, partial [Hymenobacter agri]
RRDGRGKGRGVQPSETEQFQAASFGEADEFAQQPFLNESTTAGLVPVASASESTPDTAGAAADAAALEAGRKKKRRSRGGAKRTARKHALRLAAEMGLNEGQLAASDAALEAAAAQVETVGSATPTIENTVTGAEVPEQLRDRRNDGGRGVTRVPLFAAPAVLATDATNEVAGEETIPAASTEVAGESQQPASTSSSRRNRNRKKKKGNHPAIAETAAEAGTEVSPVAAPRGAVEAVVDTETLNAARGNEQRDTRRPQEQSVVTLPTPSAAGAVAVTPVVFVSAETVAPAESSQPVAPKASKPSKRKSRLQVGGRTEKPAVDTPIIPVDAVPAVRTQVAAGRLTGTSASLVEPSAPAKAEKAPITKPAKAKAGAKKAAATEPAFTVPAVTTTVETATETSGATETPKKGGRASKAKATPQQAKFVKTTEQTPVATAKTSVPTAVPTAKAAKSKNAKAPATSAAGNADAPQAAASEPSAAAIAKKPVKEAATPVAAKPAAAKMAKAASADKNAVVAASQPAKQPAAPAKAKAAKVASKTDEAVADKVPAKSASPKKAADGTSTKPAVKRKAAPKADAPKADAPQDRPVKPAAKARTPKKPAA